MPCYAPLTGYRARTTNASGKRSIVFNLDEGFADLPVTVPCGQCIGCRLERSRQWALRCVHEAQLHVHKCFITLTYDKAHLPPGGTLVKADFQKFMKRLRKRTNAKIRYFQCGEYGEADFRPHFHALIYGYDFPDKVFYTRNKQGDTIWKSEELEALWGKGFATVARLTFETAAYTARYVVKKINGEGAAAHYRGRLPEYIAMSLKPAIGAGWYESFKDDVYPSDFLTMRGKQMLPPKYYDRILEKEDEKQYKKVKAKRMARAKQCSHNAPDRLRAREEVAKAKLNLKPRTL